jgi:hypothetical protein
MASYSLVEVGDTPTLLFSGVGSIVVQAVGEAVWIGGSAVTSSTGLQLVSTYEPLSIVVGSPDDIWAVRTHESAQYVRVFHCR